MRTIAKLCLLGTIVATAAFAAAPAAHATHNYGAPHLKAGVAHHNDDAQDRRIRKARRRANRAHERIDALKELVSALQGKDLTQDEAFNALKALVDAGIPVITQALTDLEAGLLALQAALENDVAPALEAIDAALNDETTGLVGLNLARPQFGAFEADGNMIGGTGRSGGLGPAKDAANGAGIGHPGLYVVDFENDVSSRMYSVNVFPYVPAAFGGAGAAPTASAANCASDLEGLCAAVLGVPTSDFTRANHVLVQVGAGTAAATNGFSLTAISG